MHEKQLAGFIGAQMDATARVSRKSECYRVRGFHVSEININTFEAKIPYFCDNEEILSLDLPFLDPLGKYFSQNMFIPVTECGVKVTISEFQSRIKGLFQFTWITTLE